MSAAMIMQHTHDAISEERLFRVTSRIVQVMATSSTFHAPSIHEGWCSIIHLASGLSSLNPTVRTYSSVMYRSAIEMIATVATRIHTRRDRLVTTALAEAAATSRDGPVGAVGTGMWLVASLMKAVGLQGRFG